MGLKHLQGAAWAIGLVFSVVDAAAQQVQDCSSSLVPSGCKAHCAAIEECAASRGVGSCDDKVAALDACMGIETVVGTGTDDDAFLYVNVARITATIGGLPVVLPLGNLRFAHDEDGDGVPNPYDECAAESGTAEFGGCTPETFCSASTANKFGLNCFVWHAENDSDGEWEAYLQELVAFANDGGCGGQSHHWACESFAFLAQQALDPPAHPLEYLIPNVAGWNVPNCSNSPKYTPHVTHGGMLSPFPFYSGHCVNSCQQLLSYMGLSLAAGAGMVTTAAVRVALYNAGVISAVSAPHAEIVEACSGPMFVDGM